MTKLHLLSIAERKPFFEVVAANRNLPLDIIEKDFWVVWMLGRLFSLEGMSEHLTFKGGTSLSKVFHIIERFSEDIDISIERAAFGFDETNAPEKLESKSKQKKTLEALIASCSAFIHDMMLPKLNKSVAQSLGTREGWRIYSDETDATGQTLLFEYPSEVAKEKYVRPIVKIEMGARAEHWPISRHQVSSYVKEELKDKIDEAPVEIQVLNVERTFWEKATILHEHAHLPDSKSVQPRLSRHLYDLYKILSTERRQALLTDNELLERVANHKKFYFARSWANYETARKGTLKLILPDRVMKEMEADYRQMHEMIFGERPPWDEIVKVILQFEREFNAKG